MFANMDIRCRVLGTLKTKTVPIGSGATISPGRFAVSPSASSYTLPILELESGIGQRRCLPWLEYAKNGGYKTYPSDWSRLERALPSIIIRMYYCAPLHKIEICNGSEQNDSAGIRTRVGRSMRGGKRP